MNNKVNVPSKIFYWVKCEGHIHAGKREIAFLVFHTNAPKLLRANGGSVFRQMYVKTKSLRFSSEFTFLKFGQ